MEMSEGDAEVYCVVLRRRGKGVGIEDRVLGRLISCGSLSLVEGITMARTLKLVSIMRTGGRDGGIYIMHTPILGSLAQVLR